MLPFSLEHIGLAARDTTVLKDWYERVLGARVIYASAERPFAYFLELPGGAWIEIYQSTSAVKEVSDNRLQGWRHLALRVGSIESARQELESKGIQFSEPVKPAGGGGHVLFFQDPEGNLLHLVDRPPDFAFAAA